MLLRLAAEQTCTDGLKNGNDDDMVVLPQPEMHWFGENLAGHRGEGTQFLPWHKHGLGLRVCALVLGACSGAWTSLTNPLFRGP